MPEPNVFDQILNFVMPAVAIGFIIWIFWKAACKFGADKGLAKLMDWLRGKKDEDNEEKPQETVLTFE